MAFLKDVESEELRELVKSCFKEINSLKEQLSEENKDIKTNEVVKNVLIQNENQNSNLAARINELTEDVNKKETAIKEKDLQLQEKDTTIKEKELEINELTSQLSAVQIVDNSDTESEFKKQIENLKSTIEDQNNQIKLLKNQSMDSSIQSEKELRLEISKLKEQNEELKSISSQTELNQLRSVIDRQTEELKEIPILKNQLTIEVAGRDQKIKKYEEEIEDLKSKIETSVISDNDEIIKTKDSEINALNNQILELNDTINDLKNSSDIETSSNSELQIQELTEKIAVLEKENLSLKESGTEVTIPTSDNMSSLIADFTEKSNELIKVQSELQHVQDLNKINEYKLVELENENAKLKDSINIKEPSVAIVDSDLRNEIDSLKHQILDKDNLLSSKDKEISELTSKLNSNEVINEENAIDEEEFNKLKQNLQNKTQEYDALELDLVEKDATVESLKQQYDIKSEEFEKLQSKFEDLEKSKENIQNELNILKEKSNEQNLEITSLTIGDESNSEKISELEELLSKKDEEIASLKVKLDEVAIDLTSSDSSNEIQNELKETKKLLYEKDAEFDKLKLDYNQIRKSSTKQIDELSEGISEVSNTNEKLKSENDYLNQTLNDKNVLINKLQQENQSLELLIKEKDTSYDKLKEESFNVKKINESQINKLKQEVQDKSDKISALPQKLELKDIEISQLNKLLKTKEDESATKTDTIKELRNNVQVSQEEIKQLKDQLAREAILIDDKIKAKDDELVKLNENYIKDSEEKEQEISRLTSLLNQRKFKIEELTENIESLNNDINILNNQIEDNVVKYQQSESIIKAKDDTISKQDELLNELNVQIGRFENKLKLKDDDIDDLNTKLSEKEIVIDSLKSDISDSNKKLEKMDSLTVELSQKTEEIEDMTSRLEDKDKELKDRDDTILSSTARIQELKDIVDRKNKDIDDHKQLLFDKNEELDKLKDLQPRIRSLELEKADLKSDYEKQITSLKADLQKAELLKEDNEKLDQEITRLNEVVDDKNVQLGDMSKFKNYFSAMISKPLPGLTSFQSQIYHLLPDAQSASELYDYLMELGFTELEKESFAKTLKALEKRGYCQRARDGDKIIWVKKPIDEN